MCAVSAVHDYMRTNIPVNVWQQTPSLFNEYQEIIRRLDALDKKLDQKDCPDPQKAAWMAEVSKMIEEAKAK